MLEVAEVAVTDSLETLCCTISLSLRLQIRDVYGRYGSREQRRIEQCMNSRLYHTGRSNADHFRGLNGGGLGSEPLKELENGTLDTKKKKSLPSSYAAQN